MDFKTLRECAAAYNAVYDQELRQEIKEQQEFENWVNSLVEEGYDLSGYTWEDMYEEYLNEMGQTRTTGQNPSVFTLKTTPGAGSASGQGGRRGSGSNPSAPRPTAAKPANEPYKSRFAGARDAAVKKAQAIKGSPVVGTKPAPSPAAKPAPTPAAKPAPTAAAKPTPTPTAKPAPEAKVGPAPTAAPKPTKIQQDVADLKSMQAASQARQAAPAPKLSARAQALKAGGPQGGARERMLNQDVDLFDIIQGYLLDEGYAETLQEAEWMMANLIDEEAIAIILGESALGTMAVLGGMAAGRAIHGKLQDRKAKKELEGKRRTSDYLGMKSRTKNVVARDRRASGDTRNEEFELWVNELVEEGYDLSDYTWDEMYEFYLDEALTGERYKKVMKKPGGTAYSRKVSADPAKRATRGGKGGESDFGAGDRGSGNRAARRAGTYQEEYLDEISQKTATKAYAASATGEFEGADSDRDLKRTDNLKKHIVRKFGKEAGKHAEKAAEVQTFGRKDASGRRKQSPQPRIQTSDHENQREFKRELRIRRDKRLRAKDNVNEAQAARENPEKYEREQAKKSAPVRGERTPMPPRGDKRREEFEKWYAKQMGR